MDDENKGVIVIDKPANVSSAKVVSIIKRILGARKVGHAGTLDPMATGVLVCCINDATRLARFFLTGEKTYEAVLHLGIETDTQDATGAVIATSAVTDLPEHVIESVFMQFTGPIQQRPPIFSALKHKGVALYKLARKGIQVQKPSRQVVISDIQIRYFDLPEIHFSVTCSSGTYVRTLCADIGNALGCGGHLTALRRTGSGGFTLDDAISIEDLEKQQKSDNLTKNIIGMNDALRDMPLHRVNRFLAEKIKMGYQLTRKDIPPITGDNPGDFIKIVDENNMLIAVIQENASKPHYSYCCVFQR